MQIQVLCRNVKTGESHTIDMTGNSEFINQSLWAHTSQWPRVAERIITEWNKNSVDLQYSMLESSR